MIKTVLEPQKILAFFFMIQYKSNLVLVVTAKIPEILCTLTGGL